jgi:hypothetical protein
MAKKLPGNLKPGRLWKPNDYTINADFGMRIDKPKRDDFARFLSLADHPAFS